MKLGILLQSLGLWLPETLMERTKTLSLGVAPTPSTALHRSHACPSVSPAVSASFSGWGTAGDEWVGCREPGLQGPSRSGEPSYRHRGHREIRPYLQRVRDFSMVTSTLSRGAAAQGTAEHSGSHGQQVLDAGFQSPLSGACVLRMEKLRHEDGESIGRLGPLSPAQSGFRRPRSPQIPLFSLDKSPVVGFCYRLAV